MGLECLLAVVGLKVTSGSDEQVTTAVSPAATAPLYYSRCVTNLPSYHYDFL